jgi:hypothetical protein
LRWAHCPDDRRLHLLQLAQVLHAAAEDDTRARWLTFALERVARVGMVKLAEPDEHELARVVLTDTGLVRYRALCGLQQGGARTLTTRRPRSAVG